MRNGLKFRRFTGASIGSLLTAALAMNKTGDLSKAQAVMSANAPMMIQQAMVEGNPDSGVLPSGQVAAVIDELLSCEQIIDGIMSQAHQRLQQLASLSS